MKAIVRATILLIAALLTVPGGASASGAGGSAPAAVVGIATSNKLTVERKYNQDFLPTQSVSIDWTGTTTPCQPGTISDAAQEATFKALNFVRGMTHLDPVSLYTASTQGAQEAALMMHANGQLNNSPPSGWQCYTDEGAAVAGTSLLASGLVGPRAVALYMRDSAPHAGNRRWLLHPTTTQMGHGATSAYDVLQVLGVPPNDAASKPEWVPWPSAGFFPAPLEPNGLWSLSSAQPGIDFSAATVTVTDQSGTELAVVKQNAMQGFGNPAVVWTVSGLTMPTATADKRYTVTVDDIELGGSMTSHTYQVKMFTPLPQHVVNVTFGLRRHLIASVGLSSSTLAACRNRAPVLIQRRVSGIWRTIRRIDAPHNASMAIRIPDRTGTYRAKVLSAVVDGSDRCLPKISKTARHTHG